MNNIIYTDKQIQKHNDYYEGYQLGEKKGYEAGYKDGWNEAKNQLIAMMRSMEKQKQ